MSENHPTDRSIDEVERRLELRRGRLARHVEELEAAARERARPLPLVALAVFAIAGFMLVRSRVSTRREMRPVRAVAARTGVFAALAAALQLALRFAGHPLVRRGWKSLRRSHVRR
jgi:hypothetical protein